MMLQIRGGAMRRVGAFTLLLLVCTGLLAAPATAATPVILGVPQPWDPAREEPFIAGKLRFGPGGSTLTAWRPSGRVEYWSLENPAADVRWNTATVYADSPDLKEAVGLVSGRLALMSTGRSERPRGAPPAHLALSQNQRLAVAADTPGVVLRDLRTGQARAFGTELPVRNGLAISPDGRYVVAATGKYADARHETAIEIHDIHQNQRHVLKSSGVVLGMWQMSVSHNNLLALGTQRDGKGGVLVLDLATNGRLFEQGGFESYWVRGLALSADGSVLVTGDEKGRLRIWGVKEKRKLFDLQVKLPIQTVAIDHARRRVAWSLWDGTIHVATMAEGYGSFATAAAVN